MATDTDATKTTSSSSSSNNNEGDTTIDTTGSHSTTATGRRTEVRVWIKTSLVTQAKPHKTLWRGGSRRPAASTATIASDRHSLKTLQRTHSCDELPAIAASPTTQRARLQRNKSGDDAVASAAGLRLSDMTRNGAISLSISSVQDETPYEWTQAWMTKLPVDDDDDDDNPQQLSIRVEAVPADEAAPITLTLPIDKIGTDILIANQTSHYPDDLVTLQHFHEPTVVECLQHRYNKGLIYTATGPVLIACNPFQQLPAVYGDDVMALYWTKAEQSLATPLPPHTYAIADSAFRSMMRGIQMSIGLQVQNDDHTTTTLLKRRYDQSVLVSGESGSGKTVTTKHLMKYLAALSQRSALAASSRSTPRAYQKVQAATRDRTRAISTISTTTAVVQKSTADTSTIKGSSIEAQVLQSNPILESFGNARTIRNDNSSRFGKFIDMQFTRTGRLVGTRFETYLLEKVRLVAQMPGERNYHVFYELLSGELLAEDLERLYLHADASPADFKLLSSGAVDRRDGVSDRDTYRDLRKAMKVMGFSDEERENVLRTTAAILHAANLSFCDKGNGEESELDMSSAHLAPACSLLGVTPEALNDALCYVSINALGKTIRKTQNVERARKGLDALLKAAYGALFEYLVSRINHTISFKITDKTEDSCRPVASIGVLDIFGFESFKINSFEQLCINFCNEALQQQFNTFMLKNEQAEYVSEGIDWSFIQFPENQDVLDLIELKPDGIMVILDDMCRAPNASDIAFGQKVYKAHDGSNERFKKCKLESQFGVNHFAGVVEYTVVDFVEKNRDDLPPEASELLFDSTDPFLHKLAEIISPAQSEVTAAATNQQSKAPSRPTVGGFFRQQVKDLRGKIDATSPHYVRCIKPNEQLVPNKFDVPMAAQQLRCGGILQAVSVTRSGFTLHYSHLDFIKRYGLIVNQRVPSGRTPATAIRDLCKETVERLLELITEDELVLPVEHTDDADDNDEANDDQTGTLLTFGKSKVLLKIARSSRWNGDLVKSSSEPLHY